MTAQSASHWLEVFKATETAGRRRGAPAERTRRPRLAHRQVSDPSAVELFGSERVQPWPLTMAGRRGIEMSVQFRPAHLEDERFWKPKLIGTDGGEIALTLHRVVAPFQDLHDASHQREALAFHALS